MSQAGSIFLEFNLPNATTWFYFSFLLAVALFFKFSRLLSVRNWDVVTVFLLVPGLLLLQEGRPNPTAPSRHPAAAVAALVSGAGGLSAAVPAAAPGAVGALMQVAQPSVTPSRLLWFGYLWLLCGSAYFLVRCLFDLALVRRPALSPNLTLAGLAWLAGTLFVCLTAVALRTPETPATVENGTSHSTSASRAAADGRQSTAWHLAQRSLGPRFWVTRGFALFCHLAVVVGLVVIGRRHFQDATAGMAAATFYLMLPYTGLFVGEVQHVWPMALMVWALAAYRLPTVAGALLGLAAGTVYFPALVFPVWLSFYWGRGAGRFLTAFVLLTGLCLGTIGTILWLDGELGNIVMQTLAFTDWQPWNIPTTEGFWTQVHWAYRIPIFIAYLAFVVTTAAWPAPKNLAHLMALSAAVLIGLQFWYAYQGGTYVLWYLPYFLLLMFRPNLSERRPLPLQPETDWLSRWGRSLGRFVGWLFKAPEPVKVSG
jgi:hypothetical protein